MQAVYPEFGGVVVSAWSVKARLLEEQAPTRLLQECSGLPDGRVFQNVAEVWEDLTGQKEAHRF